MRLVNLLASSLSLLLLVGCVTTSDRIASLSSKNDMTLCIDYLTSRFNTQVQDAQAQEIYKRKLSCAPYQETARMKIEADAVDRARSQQRTNDLFNIANTLYEQGRPRAIVNTPQAPQPTQPTRCSTSWNAITKAYITQCY